MSWFTISKIFSSICVGGMPAAILDVAVVEVGNQAEADLVAERHTAITVKQVGMIIVHQLLYLVVPLLLPLGIVAIPTRVARIGWKMI